MVCSGAFRADAEELEFVVEVLVAGLAADFVFELVDRTGRIDWVDGAALGADQVVAMLVGEDEGKVGGPFVQAETTDHAGIGEAMKKAINGGFVALGGKGSGFLQLGQGHRLISLEQSGKKDLQSLGSSQAALAAAVEEVFKICDHTVSLPPIGRERQDFPLFPPLNEPTREGT